MSHSIFFCECRTQKKSWNGIPTTYYIEVYTASLADMHNSFSQKSTKSTEAHQNIHL